MIRTTPILLLLVICMACGYTSNEKKSVFKGEILDENGLPLVISHVHITPLGRRNIGDAIISQQADELGGFELNLPKDFSGLVYFSSPNRPTYTTFIQSGNFELIEATVRLGTFEYNDMSEVGLIGTMNDFQPRNKLFLNKQPDDSYNIEFDTDLDTIQYQVTSVTRRYFISGTEPDQLFNSDLHYLGDKYVGLAISKEGKINISFNPENLSVGGIKSTIIFKNPLRNKIARIFNEMINGENEKEYQDAFFKHLISRNSNNLFTFDWSNRLSNIEQQLSREKDSFVRQLLLLNYAYISTLYGQLNRETAELVFREISPTSELWMLNPKAMISTSTFSGGFSTNKSYINEAINDHPSEAVKVSLLYNLTNVHYEAGDDYSSFYNMLTTNYPESNLAKRATRTYSGNRVIKIGSPIPHFSMKSIDAQSKIVTNQTMLGKVYLIDFWATWCGPCIWEFPYMEKVYEKYAKEGFEIITVSFDASVDKINSFREGKNKMPWFNAWERKGLDAASISLFEVTSIPKPILVNKDGIIIGLGSMLSGEQLEKTVSQALTLN